MKDTVLIPILLYVVAIQTKRTPKPQHFDVFLLASFSGTKYGGTESGKNAHRNIQGKQTGVLLRR